MRWLGWHHFPTRGHESEQSSGVVKGQENQQVLQFMQVIRVRACVAAGTEFMKLSPLRNSVSKRSISVLSTFCALPRLTNPCSVIETRRTPFLPGKNLGTEKRSTWD